MLLPATRKSQTLSNYIKYIALVRNNGHANLRYASLRQRRARKVKRSSHCNLEQNSAKQADTIALQLVIRLVVRIRINVKASYRSDKCQMSKFELKRRASNICNSQDTSLGPTKKYVVYTI